MATTSPDDIWTPDSGDDYALTVDLAAMADTVQDALNTVKTYQVGTDAQRTALSGASLFKGLKFYANDTNLEWVYNGTDWKLAPAYLGTVTQTSNLSLTGSFQELPGMSFQFVSPVACTIKITAVVNTRSSVAANVAAVILRRGTTALNTFTDSANSSPSNPETVKSHTVVYVTSVASGTSRINVGAQMAVGSSGAATTDASSTAYLSVERVG